MQDTLSHVHAEPLVHIEAPLPAAQTSDASVSPQPEAVAAPPPLPKSKPKAEKTVSIAKSAEHTDSIGQGDSVPDKPAHPYITVSPKGTEGTPLPVKRIHDEGVAASGVMTTLVLLFLAVALWMGRNLRTVRGLFAESVSAPGRRNMFADTVRETAFVVLLNLLCIASVGVLLWCGVDFCLYGSRASAPGQMRGVWVCIGISACYYAAQYLGYSVLGWIMGGYAKAGAWVKGFAAGQGLTGTGLFAAAICAVIYPGGLAWLLPTALAIYICGRILFIIKGVRIFNGRDGHLLLFFYYLCGVELVPALLTWAVACRLAG